MSKYLQKRVYIYIYIYIYNTLSIQSIYVSKAVNQRLAMICTPVNLDKVHFYQSAWTWIEFWKQHIRRLLSHHQSECRGKRKKCRMPLDVIVTTNSAVGHEPHCLTFNHKTGSKMRTNKLRLYKCCGEKYTNLDAWRICPTHFRFISCPLQKQLAFSWRIQLAFIRIAKHFQLCLEVGYFLQQYSSE